ncbi:uncharacterized protein SOCEGT47_055540 [Sorangium cellulosum]|jgi:hypothetical protein|uniref:Uncharacterized protein n=1 Tax=Sorangium cellulosum TaxID=56 RepID=A0A4P2Q7M2_SORCE|nr:uncharacterized protein SOCEGT47_055540 [Sorangium cellulosum]
MGAQVAAPVLTARYHGAAPVWRPFVTGELARAAPHVALRARGAIRR